MDKTSEEKQLVSSLVPVTNPHCRIKLIFYKLFIASLVILFAIINLQNFYLNRAAHKFLGSVGKNVGKEDSSIKNKSESHKNQSQNQSQLNNHDFEAQVSLFDFLLPKKSWLNVDLQMRYLINNDICSSYPAKNQDQKAEILMVNLVPSGTMNRRQRDAVRSSIPKEELKRLGIRRVFLLARPEPQQNSNPTKDISNLISHIFPFPSQQSSDYSNEKTTVQIKDLILENEEHQDLLVGDFLDTYKNLTYKSLMGLDWATKFCPQAKFIVKNDDDIVVDFYQLSSLLSSALSSSSSSMFSSLPLKKLIMSSNDPAFKFVSSIKKKLSPSSPDQRFIMGSFLNRVVERSRESKFYVSYDEYPPKEWPMYSCGMGYVTTVETARDLVRESKTTKFFWIEDVHITGFLREKANIEFISMETLTNYYTEQLHCCSPKYLEDMSKLDQQLNLDILINNNNNNMTNIIPNFLQPRWCHYFFGQVNTNDLSLVSNYMKHAKFCHDSNLCKRWENLNDAIEECAKIITKQK